MILPSLSVPIVGLAVLSSLSVCESWRFGVHSAHIERFICSKLALEILNSLQCSDIHKIVLVIGFDGITN